MNKEQRLKKLDQLQVQLVKFVDEEKARLEKERKFLSSVLKDSLGGVSKKSETDLAKVLADLKAYVPLA